MSAKASATSMSATGRTTTTAATAVAADTAKAKPKISTQDQLYTVVQKCFIRRRFQRAVDLSLRGLEQLLTTDSAADTTLSLRVNTWSVDSLQYTVEWDAIEKRLKPLADSIGALLSESKTGKTNSRGAHGVDLVTHKLCRVEAYIMIIVQCLYEMDMQEEACKVVPLCFRSTSCARPTIQQMQIDLQSNMGKFSEALSDLAELKKMGKGGISREDLARIEERIKHRQKKQQEREEQQKRSQQAAQEQERILREYQRQMLEFQQQQQQQQEQLGIQELRRQQASPSSAQNVEGPKSEQGTEHNSVWQNLLGIIAYVLHIINSNMRSWLIVLLLAVFIAIVLHSSSNFGPIMLRLKRSLVDMAQAASTL